MNKKIEPKPLTLKSILDYSVKNFAKMPSVSFVDGTPITYSQLGKKIEETASKLFALGLEKGDKVALFSHNMPNWVIAYFSVVSNGLIIVPVLPDFTREEVENVLVHSESKVLFISERLISRVEGLELPSLEATILLDDFSQMSGTKSINTETVIPKITVKENDTAAIIYTSGTTGRSKGVVLSHKSIAFVAMQSFTFQPISRTDVFLSLLPLSHTYENTLD